VSVLRGLDALLAGTEAADELGARLKVEKERKGLMGEFPRKSDGRRVFTVEFKRGLFSPTRSPRRRCSWRSTSSTATAAS